MSFTKTITLRTFVLIGPIFLLLADVKTARSDTLTVPVIPLTSAPLSPSAAASSADDGQPLNPRAAIVAKRLRVLTRTGAPRPAALSAKTAGSAGSANHSAIQSFGKRPASLTPRKAWAADNPIKLRISMHRVGTPRWMHAYDRQDKIGQPAGRQPKVLQAALGGAKTDPAHRRDDETVKAFLWAYRHVLRLRNPDDELQLLSQETDELGRRHYRYIQRYRGLPVWPSGLVVHLDREGNVDLMNGSHVPTPSKVPPEPIVDHDAALAKARAMLQLPAAEATTSQLLLYAAVDSPTRLAWALEIDAGADVRWRILVDAVNGRILNAYNAIEAAAAPGSGIDLLGQPRVLSIWQNGASSYLVDTSKPMFDGRSNPLSDGKGVIQILDARNLPATSDPENRPLPRLVLVSSNQPNGGWLPDGVSAAANFSATYDYYQNRFTRNSVDNQGSSIRAVVRLARNYRNAFWSSDSKTMFFGDAEPYAGALDVVAHELTHGITDYSARLEYLNQSGALNEAFSDIFGEMVERYATASNDWLIGTNLSQPLRSLSAPGSIRFDGERPYPSKMSEYLNMQEDNGGVHINSSIINRAYFLLAEGLDDPLGTGDAERIFFRALTVHLTAKSQFVDARLACIQSAEELFGAGSRQAQRTAAAFDAVEIFDRAAAPDQTPVPAASGEDAVIFLYFDSTFGGFRLARREAALGDGSRGSLLSIGGVSSNGRPSITADGRAVLFVDDFNDICVIATDSPGAESCLGLYQVGVKVHAATMAPDGRHFAYLLLDASGQLDKKIYYYDSESNQAQTFDLVAPASEGVSVDVISAADALDISLNNRYLVYDALNQLTLEDGTEIGAWSIYAYDLATGNRLAVVPPIPGQDIGNPSMGRASSNLIVFEARPQNSTLSRLQAARLDTASQAATLLEVETGDLQARPVFSGNDDAVIYSTPNAGAATGASLWRAPVDQAQLTAGTPQLFLPDGMFGTVYRRGGLSYTRVRKGGRGSGSVFSNFEGIDCGVSCSALYPPGLALQLRAQPDYGSKFAGWSGACKGRGSVCTVTVGPKEKTIRALFRKLPKAVLRVAMTGRGGSGKVSSVPLGIDCGAACRATFIKGTNVVLNAIPESGSRFVGWGGGCRGTGNCSLQMKGQRKVVARFSPG